MVKNPGFHLEYAPGHMFRVVAVKDYGRDSRELFAPDEIAKHLLWPFQKKRNIGFIAFDPTDRPDLLTVDFKPFPPSTTITYEMLTGRRLASKLELLALEHLKKSGYNGFLQHNASTEGRMAMLEKSGRKPFGIHHIDEEIALMKKYLEKEK
jgi:hypothetical protein